MEQLIMLRGINLDVCPGQNTDQIPFANLSIKVLEYYYD